MLKRFILAILFILFEVVDFCITIWAVKHGIAEMNPLVAPLVLTWQYPLIKLVLPVLTALLLVVLGFRVPRLTFGVLVVLCVLSGAVAIFQVYGLCYYLRVS
jgi:hypothetical protein